MVDLLLEHGATGGLIDVMNAFEKGNYDLADMVADTSMTGEDCEGYLLGAWKYKAYVLQEEVDKLRSELAAALKQQVTSTDTCDCACCLIHLSMSALMFTHPPLTAMLCGHACVLHAP